jgi:hypothetical protein
VPKKNVEHTAKGTAGGGTLPLWGPFAENRFERKRKLLPTLKLKYPTNDEISQLAKLMKVSDASRLSGTIRSVILDAHLNHKAFQGLSKPEVRKACKNVTREAAQLKETLSELDVGRGARGSLDEAGFLIEWELFRRHSLLLLPEYIELLDALSVAAQQAANREIYSPRGAGGNPAFDMFIQRLLMTVRLHAGRRSDLKVYRKVDGEWGGSLMDALRLLEEYLPPGFVANGRSVEHIKKKFMHTIKRAEQSEAFRRKVRGFPAD